MGRFVKGEVVVLPFPFSDLSSSKRRPAVVVSNLTGDDLILCQITTNHRTDGYSISLSKNDFKNGSLKRESCIRPNRIFTGDSSIIHYSVGTLSQQKIHEVISKIVGILNS